MGSKFGGLGGKLRGFYGLHSSKTGYYDNSALYFYNYNSRDNSIIGWRNKMVTLIINLNEVQTEDLNWINSYYRAKKGAMGITTKQIVVEAIKSYKKSLEDLKGS